MAYYSRQFHDTAPPPLPPATRERLAAELYGLWVAISAQDAEDRVVLPHLVLLAEVQRSIAGASALLFDLADQATRVSIAHHTATLLRLSNDGALDVAALRSIWDSAAWSEREFGRFTVRMPVLGGLATTLPLDPRYRALSGVAQLVLLAIAGETNRTSLIRQTDLASRTALPASEVRSALRTLVTQAWLIGADSIVGEPESSALFHLTRFARERLFPANPGGPIRGL